MADPLIVPSPSPFSIRLVTPGDALRAVSGDGLHLGVPRSGLVSYRYSERHGFEVVPRSLELVSGDTYVASVADWITEASTGTTHVGTAASWAARLLDWSTIAPLFGPLSAPAIAWDVPPRTEFEVPTPAHTLMQFSGCFGNPASPVEEWSWSLKAAADPTPQDQGALDFAANQMINFYGARLQPQMHESVVLTQALYARVDAAGHVARFPDGSFQQGKIPTVLAGRIVGGTRLPLQTALVVSLATGRADATGKGRCFLPYQREVGADFSVPIGVADQIGTAMGALLADLNGLLGDIVVASSKGYVSPVTSIRVGRAPDTMRSRRANLPESYKTYALVSPGN